MIKILSYQPRTMQLLRLTGTKSGSAILATLILVALTAGAAQSKNIASGYVFPVFPGKTGPEGKLNETPYMRLGPQAAPWLPHFISILKANRPPRFKLGTVALLFGELDRLYLAIIWRGATVQTPLLEFHSIKRVDNNRRRLNYLRSFQDWSISLAPPDRVADIRGRGADSRCRFEFRRVGGGGKPITVDSNEKKHRRHYT